MAEKPDPELDELLDAAAKDFKKTEESEASTSNFDPSQILNSDMPLENFPGLEQLQKEFADAFAKHGVSPDDLSNQLKDLTLPGAEEGAGVKEDFSDAIMEAMRSLKENLGEGLNSGRGGEDGDGEGVSEKDVESLANIMQHMMLSLLSKEMLLPSFKEMSEKYPGWLEENKSKVSEEDLKRYTSQLEVMQQIVAELEKEGSEDDKQHLDRMMELMGTAQELGQPPQELTSQLGNALDDSKVDAILKNSGADQCSIM